AQCLLQSFTVDGPSPPTLQGFRIAMRGDLLVSTYTGEGYPTAHACFVWRRSSGAWGLEASIVPSTFIAGSDPDEGDTADEQVVIKRTGSLYIYTHDTAGWSLQAELKTSPGAYWGHPEIDGDRLVSRVSMGSDPEELAVLQKLAGQWVTTASVPIPSSGTVS